MGPFDFAAGTYQGRIAVTGAPNGSYVYELGHALPGQVVRLSAGDDSNAVTQTADFYSSPFTRATVKIRAPESTPDGVTWVVNVKVGKGLLTSDLFLHHEITRDRVLDIALPTGSYATGTGPLKFELKLSGSGTVDVELPSVQIDNVVLDPTTGIILANQDPAPGDVQVPLSGPISVDVLTDGATSIDTTDIYVDGVLSFSGGAVQAGFSGSANVLPDDASTRFTIAPDDAFESATQHTVRVVARGLQTQTLTVDSVVPPNDFYFADPHGLVGGTPVTLSTTGTLPAPLVANTTYYAYEDDFVSLAFSATPNGPWIELLDVGTGTHTVEYGWTNHVIDQAYSFTTVDLVGPVIVAAQATDEAQVKVTFSEPLSQAGSYMLSLTNGAPAVTPTVLSAEIVNGSHVVLTLSEEMTGWATYAVSVSGAADVYGNARSSEAQFTAYQCPQPDGRSFDLFSMLLASDQRSDELHHFVLCYQDITNLLLCKIDRFLSTAIDPDTAAEAHLDAMLRDLGNPFGFDMSVLEKRKLLSVLVAIYKQKGTDQGIINAVRFFLGLDITIDHPWSSGWHVGKDDLGVSTTLGSTLLADVYSYRILSPIYLTDRQRKSIIAIAKHMQRSVCHLRTIVEPSAPPALPDHWELGLSRLGTQTYVHN